MSKMKKRVTTNTITQLFLTGEDILQLLKDTGTVPQEINADVTFKVPGGGDWSHMTVDIDEDNVIQVSYEENNRYG